VGSSTVSRDFTSSVKFSFGIAAFLFGHNKAKRRDKTRLTNSKVSWIDIQFASSRLTTSISGSSSVGKDDEDTPVNPAKQVKIQVSAKYTSMTEVGKRRQVKSGCSIISFLRSTELCF
jgi:hypothetical protein